MTVEKSYVIFGTEVVDVIVSSATSKGQFSVLVETVQPGFGPPPHKHTHEDELFVPIEGTFEMFDGAVWHPLTKTGHHCPRGLVHTFRNAGADPGQLMVTTPGSNFDTFLEKLIPLEMPQDMQKLIDISAEHGITYILPEAPEQKADAAEHMAVA